MARKTPVEHYRSLPESAEDTGALIHEMKVEARKKDAEEQSGESDKKIMADAERRGEKQIALAEHKAGLAAESVAERGVTALKKATTSPLYLERLKRSWLSF